MANEEVDNKNVELELFPKEEVEELKQVEVLMQKMKNGEKLSKKIVDYLKKMESLDFDVLLKEVPDRPIVGFIANKLPGVTEIHIVCGDVVVKVDPKTNSASGYTIAGGKRVWAQDLMKEISTSRSINDALLS